MTKKMISLFLALLMVALQLPVGVLAAPAENCTNPDCTHAAAIGATHYDTLIEALAALPSDNAVVLLVDQEITGETPLSLKDVTLDLGGKALTASLSSEGNTVIKNGTIKGTLENKGALTLENVQLEQSSGANLPTLCNREGAVLEISALSSVKRLGHANQPAVLNEGGAVTSSGAITAANGHAVQSYGGSVTINGGTVTAGTNNPEKIFTAGIALFNRSKDNVTASAQCTVNGGTVSGQHYAVIGNNLYSGGDPGCSLTVLSGTLRSGGTAIYWPHSGALVIGKPDGKDSEVIIEGQNGSGVEICCGSLTLQSGTVIGHRAEAMPNETLLRLYGESSGSPKVGDALTVAANCSAPYAKIPLTVTIKGGLLKSDNNCSLRAIDCQMGSGQKVDMRIEGGKFASRVDLSASGLSRVISGGLYTNEIGPEFFGDDFCLISEAADMDGVHFTHRTVLKKILSAVTDQPALSAAVSENVLRFSGILSEEQKATITYTLNDTTTGTFTVAYDTNTKTYVTVPAVITVAGVSYTTDFTGVKPAPADLFFRPGKRMIHAPADLAQKPAGEKKAIEDAIKALGKAPLIKNEFLLEEAYGITKKAADGSIIIGGEAFTEVKIKEAMGDKLPEGQTAAVVVQPYVEVTVTGAALDEKKALTAVTYDITPKYKVLATTAKGSEAISGENSVLLSEGKLPMKGTVQVALSLPAGFVPKAETTCVKHQKDGKVFYYKPDFIKDEALGFTVPNGFCPFTVLNDNRMVKVIFLDRKNDHKETLSYRLGDVGTVFPQAENDSSHTFRDWVIKDRHYTALTEELFGLIAAEPDSIVTAKPRFTYHGSYYEPDPEPIPEPAPKPKPKPKPPAPKPQEPDLIVLQSGTAKEGDGYRLIVDKNVSTLILSGLNSEKAICIGRRSNTEKIIIETREDTVLKGITLTSEKGGIPLELSFSGPGKLTLKGALLLDSPEDHILFHEGANVAILTEKTRGLGLSCKGETGCALTVNGTLSVRTDGRESAVLASRVMIGEKGRLTVEGKDGLLIKPGTENAFRIETGGVFDSRASHAALLLPAEKPEGAPLSPDRVIVLPENYVIKSAADPDGTEHLYALKRAEDENGRLAYTIALADTELQLADGKLIGAAGKLTLEPGAELPAVLPEPEPPQKPVSPLVWGALGAGLLLAVILGVIIHRRRVWNEDDDF